MTRSRYALGKALSAVVTPSLRSTTFGARDFPGRTSPAAARLQRIPQTVVCGFEWSLEEPDLDSLAARLSIVDVELRGFAVEGAAMGLAITDALSPRSRRRLPALLAGPAQPYLLLSLIGVGFAMNHLPRTLWPRLLPQLPDHPYLPAADWLAVDGYGFDLAYFDTATYVDRQARPRPYSWRGDPEYFLRAVDQGIGRALWFICGAQPTCVGAAVKRFALSRRPDLWSGVGLAATFAGPATPESMHTLCLQAGADVDHLKQGSAFAARARVDGGHVPDFSAAAAHDLTGTDARSLASIVEQGLGHTGPPGSGDWETLRTHVRRQLK